MNGKTQAQSVCESGILERPRYYARQLITSGDMTLEQTYFRDKLRRHNRFLHGWGVVCGGEVCLVPKQGQKDTSGGSEPWKVSVSKAYILGPYGDEILIDAERVVDLRSGGVTSTSGDPAGELLDPWCSPIQTGRLPDTVWVAVKYKDIMTRPVRAQPAGCGCDSNQCEYSRICDGYEIGVLTECPASHQNPPQVGSVGDLINRSLEDCLACPQDPWVVLAKVQLDTDGTIKSIDNCSCRRVVASLANVWGRCGT